MTDYRVVVVGLFDGIVINELPVQGLQFTTALDNAGSAGFRILKHAVKATRTLLEPGERRIQIKDGDTLKYQGFLGPVRASSSGGSVDFSVVGYFDRLMSRLITADSVFSSDEQFDIAWTLIDDSQAKAFGDLGIRRWTDETPSGVNRTVTYLEADQNQVGQVISDLSGGIDGFDFEITPDLVWKVYSPAKGNVTNAVLELGKNIRSYDYSIDPTGMGNYIIGTGSGAGDDQLSSVAQDTDSQARYGLLETTVSFSDIVTQATLDGLTAQELINRATPAEQPSIVLKVDIDSSDDAFDVGDQLTVRIDDGYLQVDDLFRVLTKTVAVDAAGQQTGSITFEAKSL